jgi:hypothetical protein
MSAAFTPERYAELLRALLVRGYTVTGYAGAEPSSRHLVLRHDLDMSLQAAEPIAQVEAALGVGAHYFVLLRTEMYNPFSAAARATLDRIRGLGHEIGLHLDTSLYGHDPEALEQAVARECGALEDAAGAPVRVVSFHRPAEALLGYGKTLAGRRHTYEPRFFKDIGYCSDSRGGWHHGAPLDHPAVAQGRALQLLTHPIWWTGAPSEPIGRLGRFLEMRRALLDSELARNCSIYRPAAKAGEDA